MKIFQRQGEDQLIIVVVIDQKTGFSMRHASGIAFFIGGKNA
jgi:hypothetical protein